MINIKRLCITLFSGLMLGMSLQLHAVDYELPDLDGHIQSMDQYQGMWVVVNYWATWCDTCLKELPDLIALHEDNQNNDIVVVGINFESINRQRLGAFVKRHAIPYPVLRTRPIFETPLGEVPALPTTYIIDPHGVVVAGQVGVVTQKEIEAFIAEKRSSDEYSRLVSKPAVIINLEPSSAMAAERVDNK